MLPNLPAPAQNLNGWQWIAFIAIFAVFTLGQTWIMHRKIDAAVAPKPQEPKPEEPKS